MSKTRFWRMAFRDGNRGESVLQDCLYRGVAAIGYWAVQNVDLSQFGPDKLPNAWRKLAPAQKASLKHVAYDMEKGHVIFVKHGPNIVGRGVVTGPYRFNEKTQLLDGCWQHEVPVEWDDTFRPVTVLLGAEQFTVKELTEADVDRVLNARPVNEMDDPDLMDSAWEGAASPRLIQHRRRESQLRLSKIARFRREHGGRLFCEVKGCRFDFEKTYGQRGSGYAQVHHTKPLATFRKSGVVRLEDLVIVCANCHAMIHRQRECLTLKELQEHMRS